MDSYVLLKYNEFTNTYIECCSSFNYELVLDFFNLLKKKYPDEYYLICHVMEDSYNVNNINR